MTKSLKQKTVSGMIWSMADKLVEQGSRFVIGIILARLLLPADFGIIGMVTVFMVVSQSFIDSGFGQALIQKRDPSHLDFSTAFIFNIVIATAIYCLIFATSGYIAGFMRNEMIEPVLKVIAVALLINSLGVIQRAILIKSIDFRTQLWIQIASNIISGTVAIIMAFKGFGVWSLAAKYIAKSSIDTLLLWVLSTWRPRLEFSWESFRHLFSFGGRILVSDVINKLYRNLYYFLIGRFFSAADLGYYTRAEQFEQLPSNILTLTIQRVSYPVLCSVADIGDNLKCKFRMLLRNIGFVVICLMAILVVVSRPLVLVLIGERWLPSASYLQMLCFAGMVVPLSYLNINLLKVKGRTDILLRLEIVKKLIAIPIVIISLRFGVQGLIVGLICASLVEFGINGFFAGRLISYHLTAQIADVVPFVITGAMIVAASYSIGTVIPPAPLLKLVVQTITGLLVMAVAGFGLRMQIMDVADVLRKKLIGNH